MIVLSTIGMSSGLPTTVPIVAPDVVVPLRSAVDTGGAQAMSNLLWEQLREEVDPQVLHTMAEGVWEMVANALEHSGTDALIMGRSTVRRGDSRRITTTAFSW